MKLSYHIRRAYHSQSNSHLINPTALKFSQTFLNKKGCLTALSCYLFPWSKWFISLDLFIFSFSDKPAYINSPIHTFYFSPLWIISSSSASSAVVFSGDKREREKEEKEWARSSSSWFLFLPRSLDLFLLLRLR